MGDTAPWLRLTGDVAVVRGRDVRAVRRPRQRAVLAALASRVGYPMSPSALIMAVWGETPPASAVGNVQTYVSGLRRLLERDPKRPDVVCTDERGYRLCLPGSHVDVVEFDRLVTTAESAWSAGDVAECLRSLRLAGDQWHGVPLPGVAGPYAERERQRLLVRRLVMRRLRARALIACGHAEQAVVHGGDLVHEYPLDERAAWVLAAGLYRSGRVDDALGELTALRDRLRAELGVQPGPAIAELYESILAGNLVEVGPRHARWTVTPAQLPHRPWGFAGRDHELAELSALVRSGGSTVLLTGGQGVGKTALALVFAYRARHRYPGGQVYMNLRGSSEPAGREHVTAADVLDHQLRAFGVHRSDMPAGVEAKSARLLALSTRRHALVLLDDAADAAQVLPSVRSRGARTVLITSRNSMPELRGVRRLTLDGPDPAAVELLQDRRKAAEQGRLQR